MVSGRLEGDHLAGNMGHFEPIHEQTLRKIVQSGTRHESMLELGLVEARLEILNLSEKQQKSTQQ